jgi:hypothetical protein
MLGGGGNRPVMGPNGQPQTDANGNVIMAPASAKQLGMGILAGAISGMVAGMAAPSKYNEVSNNPGGETVKDGDIMKDRRPDYSGSFAAGAQAATPFTQEGAQAAAQKKASGIQSQQFATMDHNLKMHQMTMANLKMQGELLQEGIDTDEPIIDGLALAPPLTNPDGTPLLDPKTNQPIQPIQAQGVPEDKLPGYMKDGSVTRQSILRDGQIQSTDENGKPILNPDGTPHMQWTYTIYDHRAMVSMTNEMKGLSNKLNDVSEGTAVNVSVLSKYARENSAMAGAQQGLSDQMKTYHRITGTEDTPVNLPAIIAANPAVKSILPQIAKYGTNDIDQMFADLEKDKTVSGPALAALAKSLGVTDDGRRAMFNKRTADTAENKTPSYAEAIAIKNDPNASPALKTTAEGIIHDTDEHEIAKENRINDNKARMEDDKQTQKDIRTHVYAMDANGNLILSNYHDNPGGETVKDGDIMKDRGAMRQLDDVQMNNSMYRVAMTKPISAGDRDKLQELEALNQQNGGNLVSFGQGGVSLNIPVISAKLNKQNLKQMTDDLNALSPNARLRYAGYLRTAASVPAYAKAISGTARQNKETLELEMANIPKPYVDDATAKVQQEAWQDNITRAANGYPTNLPGMVHPNQLKNQVASPDGKGLLVLLPTGQTAGPFPNQAAADAFKRDANIQ